MQQQSKTKAITLIGMPGVGKSTVGDVLAKRLQWGWIDSDTVIEQQNGGSLQQVLERGDRLTFRAAEEKAVLSLPLNKQVISTGGSVVYSELAMAHLAAHSSVIFLKLEVHTLLRRLGDVSQRGLLRGAQQSIEDLFKEREPMYQRWADYELECQGLSPEQIADELILAITD